MGLYGKIEHKSGDFLKMFCQLPAVQGEFNTRKNWQQKVTQIKPLMFGLPITKPEKSLNASFVAIQNLKSLSLIV